jgi:hypothetical protein
MVKQASTAGTPTVRFRTTLEGTGKNTTGIVVPDDLVAQLGKGKKPPVQVTVGGHSWRSTVAVMGGRFMVGVSAENRAKAGVAAGDDIEVELVLDEAPREIEVPADLAAALDAEPAARTFFDGLSFSLKRYHVEQVTGAKTDETRQRRIAKSVDLLKQGKAR